MEADCESQLKGFDLRNYQETLAELGKRNNIIACLPTGSGKTLIAVKLALYYNKINAGRTPRTRILFLVPTVPLANQQAKVFQKELNTKVFTGDTNRGVGDKETFENDVRGYEVLVMTAQVCLNLLDENLLGFEDMSLLVLDECHHSVKDHPMNNIMKMYKKLFDEGKANLPRILGLTATVVKKNVRTAGLASEVLKIEKGLCSTAVTYEDFQDVLEYSTKARVITLYYNPEATPCGTRQENLTDIDEILTDTREDFLKPIVSAISLFDGLPYEDKYVDHVGSPSNLGPELTKSCYKILNEVIVIYDDFGRLGAFHAASQKLRFLEDELNIPKNWTVHQRRILSLVRTSLEHFMIRAGHKYRKIDPKIGIKLWSSSKVNALYDILSSYKNKANTDDRICCLVFVQKRSSTYALLGLLQQLIESNPEEFGFLSPSIVVGVNNISQTSLSDRITKSKQTKILERFREKHFNILITTSILEEGIDVPSCNLVIRMDPIQSYTSLIQSMGRARDPNAKYIVLMSQDAVDSEQNKLGSFELVRERLTQNLCDQMKTIMAEMKIDETKTKSSEE